MADRLARLPEGTRLLVGFVQPVAPAAGAGDERAGAVAAPRPPPGADLVAAAVDALRRRGFGRLRVGGRAVAFDDLDPSALAGRDFLHVVVDRVKSGSEAFAAAHRGGRDRLPRRGAARRFAVEAGGAEPAAHEFSERFECRPCGIAYETPPADAVLLQQPVRGLSHLSTASGT